MNKRETLLQCLKGGRNDGYTPAAFFIHFDESCRSGQAAIDKHIAFFRATDMDFVKVQMELGFPRVEMGAEFDVDKIPTLDADFFAGLLEVVSGIVQQMKEEAFVVLTLYSPFMMLGNMIGRDALIEFLEREPEKVEAGLSKVSEDVMSFVKSCKRAGLDGFYHSTQGGESRRFRSLDTFRRWIKPVDLALFSELDREFELNILHICDYHQEYGLYDDLTDYLDYPGHIVNVSTEVGNAKWTPRQIQEFFGRPFLGGLNRNGVIATGTHLLIDHAVTGLLEDAPDHFIVGADCTVPANTPWDHLRRAIDVAHGVKH